MEIEIIILLASSLGAQISNVARDASDTVEVQLRRLFELNYDLFWLVFIIENLNKTPTKTNLNELSFRDEIFDWVKDHQKPIGG